MKFIRKREDRKMNDLYDLLGVRGLVDTNGVSHYIKT